MKIFVHRGQNQIGGSIIEIKKDSTRIFFDIGTNLDEETKDDYPKVEGLFTGIKDCDGVFISHYHSDHVGLINNVLKDIPIYMGEEAYKMYKAASDYRESSVTFVTKYIQDRVSIDIKGFVITPYLCDHSAHDSYMFLIDDGKSKVLYTGDFRANGRMNYDHLLSSLPTVDAIIIEGTTLSRETFEKNIDEELLEEIGTKCLSKHQGPAFLLASPMNAERTKTAYNISQNTHRIFLEDVYTASIMKELSEKYPNPDSNENIKVFITGGTKQHDLLEEKFHDCKIGRDAIAKEQFVMCIRQSMRKYLETLSTKMDFHDGVLFYGMWKGYMEQPELASFLEWMKSKGVHVQILHTSGHADVNTINKLIETVKPKMLIPVHTENATWFNQYENIIVVNNYYIEL